MNIVSKYSQYEWNIMSEMYLKIICVVGVQWKLLSNYMNCGIICMNERGLFESVWKIANNKYRLKIIFILYEYEVWDKWEEWIEY